METTILLVGNVIFGGYFFLMGINHFLKSDMLSGYASSKGVPFPKTANILAGLFLTLGGLGIVAGLYIVLSSILLIVFLIAVNFMIHSFWKNKNADEKASDLQHFLKNTALIGALLALIARVMM
ncbi:MAG: DoxX family protein [bacterium]|nr:DoxX family protein [bacterium]